MGGTASHRVLAGHCILRFHVAVVVDESWALVTAGPGTMIAWSPKGGLLAWLGTLRRRERIWP